MDALNLGKLPGKTQYAGRRRSTTRRSGFNSHPDSTGGEFKVDQVPALRLKKGEVFEITLYMPGHMPGDFLGFGGWFQADQSTEVVISAPGFKKGTLTAPENGNWSKFGSFKVADGAPVPPIHIKFIANEDSYIAIYEVGCGIVSHKHLEWASTESPVLLKNMHDFCPETNFFAVDGEVVIDYEVDNETQLDIFLKSCNRCARFLPINISNERHILSFTNHCVADHRRPCSHGGFGKLKNLDTGEVIQLDYGYQLECRFCKKFEVNAPHNCQRTPDQMKEDGTRRRNLELLLTELYEESPQLRYRHKYPGRELATDIWLKFDRKCFNCKVPIPDQRDMHLDHTRPLALLWPLDETATCLCGSCNSRKRDRSPVEFYTEKQLHELHVITNIPLDVLKNPGPNQEAIYKLLNSMDWFFGVFCQKPELQKVRDGKRTADLLIKSLQKTLNKSLPESRVNLLGYVNRR
ncbi:hypothetical protein [Litchfieldella xinjiangensis]|uniref:hypothetical protein n=1 Tax=Litchfieldella xinjiangensis TaxID=1166948 RepID=UPI000AFA88C6|nr:hypothetical protein [Halomonas xinjiangensis]